MEAILVNYNYTPEWLPEYPELNPVTIYDRSDDGVERNLTRFGKVLCTPNKGDVDFDKLSYLVENYYNLPEVFFWGKSNITKYVDEPTLKRAIEKGEFAPLLKQDHCIYSDRLGPVNMYKGGMYMERADSWFFHAGLDSNTRFLSWSDWIREFNLPAEGYIPFPPGGNYILTKERVHRYSKDFYEKMRDTLPYAMHPVEAHCAERSYYLLWR